MNAHELYELFVAPGTTYQEIADANMNYLERHVAEMRADEPDDIDMPDWDIAKAIQEYAIENL